MGRHHNNYLAFCSLSKLNLTYSRTDFYFYIYAMNYNLLRWQLFFSLTCPRFDKWCLVSVSFCYSIILWTLFFFEHFFENQDASYLSCTYTTPTLKSGIFPGSRGLFTEKCYIETKSYVLAVLVCSLLLGVLQLLDRRPGTLEKYLIWGLGHWKYKVSLENLILSKSKKVLRKTRHKT